VSAVEDFAARVAGSAELDLLDCAARIALYADPQAAPERTVAQVRAWGRQLARRMPADAACAHRLRLLNHFFFEELSFGPRRNEPLCADDSYLHRALERRTGLPIVLSVLYADIGNAAGLRLGGISFPAHFLVRAQLADAALVIDVYEGGATLSLDQLRARLAKAAPDAGESDLHAYLRPAGARDILARMLRNLKFVHAEAADWNAVLEVQQRLVALLPDAAEERRDRAAAWERLECPRAAASDLDAYLKMRPRAPDAKQLRQRLAQLTAEARNLN
jgi:regulator of sirC expression with transglutaminase-like and TPR domain